jgi:hypothetical protein
MSEAPRACSLSPSEQTDRAAEFRELARGALLDRRRHEGSVVLAFRAEAGVRDTVEDLVRRERECCPFLDFQVKEADGAIALSIGAAPEDRAALDAFYELPGSA